jgi:hypothetical protein
VLTCQLTDVRSCERRELLDLGGSKVCSEGTDDSSDDRLPGLFVGAFGVLVTLRRRYQLSARVGHDDMVAQLPCATGAISVTLLRITDAQLRYTEARREL